MVTKDSKKGTFQFKLIPQNEPQKVCIAGDFTQWQAVRMRKQKDGSYVLAVPLPKGAYQYKFQVDGNWLLDPDNHANTLNPYGTLNSLIEIP